MFFIVRGCRDNMGIDLCLKFTNGCYADATTVNAYYDHMAAKEREYYPADADEDLHANFERRIDLEISREREEGTPICERWLSRVSNANIQMDDLFDSSSDPVIYGEDIQTFIGRLREGKEQMKRRGDADKWERYFELQLITLCEFALEHDYGVEFNV